MTDDEKRGKLLSELRKKKGMTQAELSELLHYSDKNISKWECGKSFPTNPNVINSLAKIFDVSLEEIMYGELKQKHNNEAINDNLKNTYLKNYNRYIRNVRNIVMLIMVLIIISLISIYHIYIKNSIYLYSANIESDKIKPEKLFILLTPKMNLLSLDKINGTDLSITKLVLYYSKNDKEHIIFEGDNQNYYISEKYGYEEYNFNKVVHSECYLKIIYSDGSDDIIKINFKKDYNNDNIFPKSVPKISNDSNKIESNIIEKLLENGFVNNDNILSKQISENVYCYYNKHSDIIKLSIENENVVESISCNGSLSDYYYEKVIDGNIIESKKISEKGKKNCADIKCSGIQDYIMYLNYLKG